MLLRTIASKPVRMLSLVIVTLVMLVDVRGIGGGFGLSGGLLQGRQGGVSRTLGERTPAEIAYVIDGDTVEVTADGGTTARVRFLGISAPEVPHPGEPGECYGVRSTEHLEKLLPPGTDVILVSDPTQEDIDNYGRWLRYVQADGRDLGRAQIRAGAAAAQDSVTRVSRHPSYKKVARKARSHNTGMWAACD